MDHDALEFEMQVQQNLLKDGASVVDSEGVRGGSERGTKDAQRKDTHDNIQDMFDDEDDLMDEDVGEMEGVAAPHPQTNYGSGGTAPSHLPVPDTTQTKRLRKRKVMDDVASSCSSSVDMQPHRPPKAIKKVKKEESKVEMKAINRKGHILCDEIGGPRRHLQATDLPPRSVEKATLNILEAFQTNGEMKYSTLFNVVEKEHLIHIPDILNVLVATPLLHHAKHHNQQQNDEGTFVYRNGRTLSQGVHLRNLRQQLTTEQTSLTSCSQRISILKEELRASNPSSARLASVLKHLLASDPSLLQDDLYSTLFKTLGLSTAA